LHKPTAEGKKIFALHKKLAGLVGGFAVNAGGCADLICGIRGCAAVFGGIIGRTAEY
jgi:hypothetical protein